MRDSYIQLPQPGTGQKLDTEEIILGEEILQRERPAGWPVSPQAICFFEDSLAGGATVNFDCPQIPDLMTGYLGKILVCSTGQTWWSISAMIGEAETVIGHVISNGGTAEYAPPEKIFHQIPGEAFFRVAPENLGGSAQSIAATVFYDQHK